MVERKKVTQDCVRFSGVGLEFEGILHLPKGDAPLPAVVVCHPHPLYGGDMYNNVVLAISDALAEASIAALRFNFRGVGRSEGEYDEGSGEQEDVVAALAFLESLNKVDQSRIGLAGYSFGAKVALPVALRQQRVRALALVSPFLMDAEWEQLKSYAVPKLFICGSEDGFVSSHKVERLTAGLPGLSQCEVIAGADHFWGGYEAEVGRKVTAFFEAALQV